MRLVTSGDIRKVADFRVTADGGAVRALHGREAEIRAVDDALDVVAAGRGAIVLVEGEAGIGKTRLLSEALDRARARGWGVARGQAEELERSRPFGVVAGAFGCAPSSRDPRRAALGALLATHGAGDGGAITVTSDAGLQFQAVDAFVDLAEELALDGPLVVGLDDLQWADPSSVLTISTLARRLADLPVGLVGCVRPLSPATEVQRLAAALDAAGARRLTLGPLGDAGLSDLVAEAVAAEPGPRLLAEIARAAGNPLFVTELLRAVVQGGLLTVDGGRAELAGRTLPGTLRQTILGRVGFLGGETLQTLRVAAIVGTSFSLTDLSIVAARPAVELAVPLSDAVAAGVLSDDGDRLRFRHDLIRDAIYEELAGSVRLGLHREAGQRLAAAGAPAQQVAEQLARGAMPGEAVEWLVRAARAAAPTSPAAATGLLERAVDLMPPGDPGRDLLLAEHASSLLWAGRVLDAEAACDALLGRAHDPAADAPARLCRGHALLAAGRPREALDDLEAAAESPLATGAERAGGLAWASRARMYMGDLDGSAATADRARSAATAAGDPVATSTALGSLAQVAQIRRRLDDAARIIDDAVERADRSPARQGHRYPVHADRGIILIDQDRLEEAEAALRAGRRIGEEIGVGWHLPTYQVISAIKRFLHGEWDDAVAEVEASIDLAEELGVTHNRAIADSLLALIRLHRNDVAGAAQAAGTAIGDGAATGSRYRTQWSAWAHALTLEADGRIADAFAVLARVWDESSETGLVLEYRMAGVDLVRLALATGDRQRAADVTSAIERVAGRNDVASLTGAALLCRGLADGDPSTMAAAVDAYARAPRPLELARACEEAGAAFARRGDRDRAQPLLERALSTYEGLDATRGVMRAEAALRSLGVRRGIRGPRGRPRTGWASLTPTERTVADLVGEGLSNPQVGDRLYVSRRTVQTHLAHIFTKLDITSRAQLAAEVARHG
ncbi:MAG TPA: AAA family ATPase [Acidimicrobiales bacterium]|nr:AAA family ATPase [Acidimicrobiales bacterium]